MAEMVGSAVAQEAAHQVLSRFMERYEQRPSDAKECVERMEMAHIRLEAALEASHRWASVVTTSAPLLRWRSKLKRAAQECDHAVRQCRRRLRQQEEEVARHATSSLPSRVARTARSFVSSILGRGRGGDDELGGGSAAAVRRFERFADGASEFLRYMEFGGMPCRQLTPLDGLLVRHLLAGRGTRHCCVHGAQHLSLLLQPFSTSEHGRMQGTLLFFLQDRDTSENNFLLSLTSRLSESTDIVGVVVRCLELFTPHLRSTTYAVKTKLTQLPTQDLCWVSDAYSVFGRDEHRDNLHAITSQWFRPDLLCCQQQDHHRSTLLPAESLASDVYLEPVIHVYLLGHVRLSSGRRAVTIHGGDEAGDSTYLKLGGHLWPHASSEDLPPTVGGSATETISEEATKHDALHYVNISYGQLGEIMLPQAVDRLRGDMAATSYQVFWRSKHGRAYLHAEKTSWRENGLRDLGSRRGKKKKKVRTWIGRMNEFGSSWMAYAPAQLQASTVDWIQKQERPQLPLFLKIITCTHDCPVKALTLQDLRSVAEKIKSFSTFDALEA